MRVCVRVCVYVCVCRACVEGGSPLGEHPSPSPFMMLHDVMSSHPFRTASTLRVALAHCTFRSSKTAHTRSVRRTRGA